MSGQSFVTRPAHGYSGLMRFNSMLLLEDMGRYNLPLFDPSLC